MTPTSSNNSSSPLCASGMLQPRFIEISFAAELVCDQNAPNPQPSSGRCEMKMLTKYHNSVRPVSVASFPRRSKIKSGDSKIMSNIGIATVVVAIAKNLPETARRISIAQKKTAVIREVEDLAATKIPTNSMVIATHEARLPRPDLISYKLASTPAAMTWPRKFLWGKIPRNAPSAIRTVAGEMASKSTEATADRKTSFLNRPKYSSALSLFPIPITPITKKKYSTARRKDVSASTDQSVEMKRYITTIKRSLAARPKVFDLRYPTQKSKMLTRICRRFRD